MLLRLARKLALQCDADIASTRGSFISSVLLLLRASTCRSGLRLSASVPLFFVVFSPDLSLRHACESLFLFCVTFAPDDRMHLSCLALHTELRLPVPLPYQAFKMGCSGTHMAHGTLITTGVPASCSHCGSWHHDDLPCQRLSCAFASRGRPY